MKKSPSEKEKDQKYLENLERAYIENGELDKSISEDLVDVSFEVDELTKKENSK